VRELRKTKEVIMDNALVLILMDLVARRNQTAFVGDRLKCMKLPFLAANQMFEQRAKGFNLTFFKYEHGPISKGVYSAWNHLSILGLIIEDRHGFNVTPDGSALAQAILGDVLSSQVNEFFRNTIENVAMTYGHLATPRIMQIVYDTEVLLPCSGVRKKIRDVELGEDLIMILEQNEARSILEIEPAWLETLAIELNPSNKAGLTTAFSDYREGRILSHEEVWRNVPS
jgi:hypothetical protein